MKTPGTSEQRISQRLRAMALVQQGLSSAHVADRLGVDPRTVRRWKRAYRRRGEAGLRVKTAPGRQPRLTGNQRRSLVQRLLKGAITQGFATDLWTCPRIKRLIEREYQVSYHVDYIPWVMKSLGFTVQKPERQARERNEPAIRRWIERDWPRIKKRQLNFKAGWFGSTKQAFS
ncbi:MAG TPA: winged helix-turn-helix domain-containing protein [Pirellulales bacterium]|jgi:transposase|nr:winged helix-turn-helix domain-containing protein [Pirellulales bacterium]